MKMSIQKEFIKGETFLLKIYFMHFNQINNLFIYLRFIVSSLGEYKFELHENENLFELHIHLNSIEKTCNIISYKLKKNTFSS